MFGIINVKFIINSYETDCNTGNFLNIIKQYFAEWAVILVSYIWSLYESISIKNFICYNSKINFENR